MTLTFDNASTATQYTAREYIKPSHAAYRGGHLLPYQCQQIGRDLHGEQYTARPQNFYLFQTTEESRQRTNTPYLYLVQTSKAMAHTAFRTAEELYKWLRAYAITMTPKPKRWCADFILTIGDPAEWQPLEVRPI